jgi:hypothetical protein
VYNTSSPQLVEKEDTSTKEKCEMMNLLYQADLTLVAVERYKQACQEEETRRAENSMTTGRAQVLADESGSTSEAFLRPLGVFSGVKSGIAIGRWGHNIRIFDLEHNEIYVLVEIREDLLVYRLPNPLGQGQYSSQDTALGEFLFGSNWFDAAFGGRRSRDDILALTLSKEETEALLNRLREQDIDYEDYLP